MTTTPLDKAKGALAAARDLLLTGDDDQHGLLPLRDAEQFARLISVASAQSNIAIAEALERIPNHLDHDRLEVP